MLNIEATAVCQKYTDIHQILTKELLLQAVGVKVEITEKGGIMANTVAEVAEEVVLEPLVVEILMVHMEPVPYTAQEVVEAKEDSVVLLEDKVDDGVI